MQLAGIVRLFVPSGHRTPLQWVCCCGSGMQEMPIDCCMDSWAELLQQQWWWTNVGSATLSADVGS